jgi:DNA repair exonuclease SbcCD nuclease subunit
MSSKILIFGDLHLADRPPGGRVDDYATTVLGKLQEIGSLCEREGAGLALSLGDWFHIKQPNRVSHHLVRKTIEVCQAFPCEIWGVYGNHDISPDGTFDRQPLGVLQEAGAVQVPREAVLFAEFWLVPRPYNASAEGVHDGQTDPSYYSLADEERELIAKNPAPVIGLAHGSIVGPGDSRPYPWVNVDQIPGLEDYDLFISGHLHECLGVVQVGKTIFANPGSIGRTRRDIASYARTVEVLVVSIDEKGLTVEEVPLPGVAPALEVFGKREAEDAPDLPADEITQFVDVLGEGLRADELSVPELLAELGDIEPEVKAEVERLLEEVST